MQVQTSEMKDQPDEVKKSSPEICIDFLSNTIGVSREEIMEVVKHSGISSRRMAEYLLKLQARQKGVVADE